MKIFICVSCLAMLFFGCIRRPNSDISTLTTSFPKLLLPLDILYEDKNITKLENLHDPSKVSDEDVADMKKLLHSTLSKIITSLPANIDHSDTRIMYVPDGKIISYYSIYSLCESSNRSKCFRLDLIPDGVGLNIKVWQLPANEDLAAVSKSYTEANLPTLLDALRGSFPHKLGDEDLTIRHYGTGDDKTLQVIAGSAANDNRRELHISTSDGMIDNTRNALFPHVILSSEVALLEDDSANPHGDASQ